MAQWLNSGPAVVEDLNWFPGPTSSCSRPLVTQCLASFALCLHQPDSSVAEDTARKSDNLSLISG